MKYILTSILFSCCCASSVTLCMDKKAHKRGVYTPQLRYIIVSDRITINNYEPDYTHRDIEVLLDRNIFSEDTLKQLFTLLSKRFPSPERLTVDVYTSWEQVEARRGTFRGVVEGPNGSNKPTREELIIRKYPSAVLMRQDSNELFRYTIQPENLKLKTIVLKGRDPMS